MYCHSLLHIFSLPYWISMWFRNTWVKKNLCFSDHCFISGTLLCLKSPRAKKKVCAVSFWATRGLSFLKKKKKSLVIVHYALESFMDLLICKWPQKIIQFKRALDFLMCRLSYICRNGVCPSKQIQKDVSKNQLYGLWSFSQHDVTVN